MDERVPFPRRGINEAWGYTDQPGETTRDALNMRGVDPTNGRIRGAQRPGLSKHFEQVVPGSSPVLAFESVVYDNKTITYDAIDSGDLEAEWAEKTEPNRSVKNLVTDDYGNLYAVVEKTVEKRNPDGKLLWAVTLPVDNDLFTLGPLVVGSDLGVYVAVDGGAPGSKGAAAYRISQVSVANSFDTEPQVLWTYQTDRWVKEIAERNGVLYILEEDDVAHECYVTQITSLSLAVPSVVSSWSVSWPASAMVVKKDGSVVTGHPYQENRTYLPLNPGATTGLESWTLEDLDDYENRVWSWYRASDLVDGGLASDGEQVGYWPDRSGNGRDLYTTSLGSQSPPTLRVKGSFPGPSVYFDGTQGLQSAAGGGKDNQRSACKTMVPNHGEGAYCTFIVCRPTTAAFEDETDAAGKSIDARRWLFDQKHHHKHAGSASGSWDFNNIYGLTSGIMLHRKAYEGSYKGLTSDIYSGGKQQGLPGKTNWSVMGSHEPGAANAYTQMHGQRDAVAGSPWPGLPPNQGATDLRAAWTMHGMYDDPDTTEDGEALTIFTFLHCGGLMECVEVTGTIVNVAPGQDRFTLDEGQLPSHIGDGSYELFINGESLGSSVLVGNLFAYLTTDLPDGEYTAKLIPSDTYEQMTRSLFRINGQPVDRWEALPMAYRGFNSALVRDYYLDQKCASHKTGLGIGRYVEGVENFVGEIVEIVTIGRRQTADDSVVLTDVGLIDDGGATMSEVNRRWHNWPTVLTHPFYAANQDGSEVDADFGYAGANTLTTEMEKIEGWLAHRHGIQGRLVNGLPSVNLLAESLDASSASTITDVLDAGKRNTVTITVSDVSGSHVTPHVLTVQESGEGDVWTDTAITVSGLGSASGEVTRRYIRAKVTTPEAGASVVKVLLEASGLYPHPHYPNFGPGYPYDMPFASALTQTGQAWQPRLRQDAAQIVKWDAAGKMLWCLLSENVYSADHGDFFTEDIYGGDMTLAGNGTNARPSAGLALSLDEKDIYFCGPGDLDNPGRHSMGVLRDAVNDDESPIIEGRSFSQASVSLPGPNTVVFPDGTTIRLKVDEYGNVHVPMVPGVTDGSGTVIEDALRTYAEDGILLYQLETLGGSGYQNAYAVALPPENPDYYTD